MSTNEADPNADHDSNAHQQGSNPPPPVIQPPQQIYFAQPQAFTLSVQDHGRQMINWRTIVFRALLTQ